MPCPHNEVEAHHSTNLLMASHWKSHQLLCAFNWAYVSIQPSLFRWSLRGVAVSASSAASCRRLVFLDLSIGDGPGITRFSSISTPATRETNIEEAALRKNSDR